MGNIIYNKYRSLNWYIVSIIWKSYNIPHGNNGDELQLVTVFIPIIVYNNHGITKEIKRSNYIVAINSLISIFLLITTWYFGKFKK